MADYSQFQHGNVAFPLGATAVNTSLQDIDPSLFWISDYFASVITTYMGARFLTEVQRSPTVGNIPSVVASVVAYDPAPYLTQGQFAFPMLAVYRKSSKFARHTYAWMRDDAEWGVDYVLPPVTAGQAERLVPFFKALEDILLSRIENMFDPYYRNGIKVFGATAANLQSIELVDGKYGSWGQTNGDLWFPAWSGTLRVTERDMPLPSQFQNLTGIDTALDLVDGVDPIYPDIADTAIGFILPTDIASLVELVTADSGLVLNADGYHVSSWTDQSATLANQAPPASPSPQPVVYKGAVTTLVNGVAVAKPVVRYDNLAATPTQAIIAPLAVDTGRTFLVVARMLNTSARQSLFAQTVNGDVGPSTLSVEANAPSSAGSRFGLSVCGSSYDTAQPTDTNWHVFALRVSNSTAGGTIATTLDLHIDGSAALPLTLKSGAGTWNTMATSNLFALGGIPALASTTSAAADIGVAMACNAYLTDAQLKTATLYCQQWIGKY